MDERENLFRYHLLIFMMGTFLGGPICVVIWMKQLLPSHLKWFYYTLYFSSALTESIFVYEQKSNLVEEVTMESIYIRCFVALLFQSLFPVLFVISNALYDWYYFKLPRYINGSRKWMVPHQLTLEEVLLTLYEHVPSQSKVGEITEQGRQHFDLLDNVFTGECFAITNVMLTGSTAERFNAPISPVWLSKEGADPKTYHSLTSDMDFLIIIEFGSLLSDDYTFDFLNDNLLPGFAYISHRVTNELILASGIKDSIKTIVNKNIRRITRSRPPWSRDDKTYNVTVKGPALNLRLGSSTFSKCDIFDGDATFALECSVWPDHVCHWKNRPYRLWPSPEDVQRIASGGCHLVPKSQEGDKDGSSWRISFSKAEVDVSLLVPNVARCCFVGLKVILKDYLAITCNKRIRSYHLKCLLFNTLEKTDPAFWSDVKNLRAGFHVLLDTLKDAIQNRFCPHYWIPEINLFQQLEPREGRKLLILIGKIETKPEKYIEILKIEKTKMLEEASYENTMLEDRNNYLIY